MKGGGEPAYQVTISVDPARFKRIADLAIQGAFPEAEVTFTDVMHLARGSAELVWNPEECVLVPLTGFDLIYDLQSYESTKTPVTDE